MPLALVLVSVLPMVLVSVRCGVVNLHSSTRGWDSASTARRQSTPRTGRQDTPQRRKGADTANNGPPRATQGLERSSKIFSGLLFHAPPKRLAVFEASHAGGVTGSARRENQLLIHFGCLHCAARDWRRIKFPKIPSSFRIKLP